MKRTYWNAPRSSLHISIIQEGQTIWAIFRAKRATYRYLAYAISGLLTGKMDCHFGIAPFSGGSSRFIRNTQSESSGLYIHLQPCPSNVKSFPKAFGLSWVCFNGHFEGVPEADRDYDPCFLLIEGKSRQLKFMHSRFMEIATKSDKLIIPLEKLEPIFGKAASLGLQMIVC